MEDFFFQGEDGIRDSSVTGVQTCALPIFINQLYGVTRNDGTDDGFRVQGIACRQAIGPSHKLAEEFFVDLALNDDSAGIETDLALMKEGTERRRADSIVHIDVVENNHRIETAKLHHGQI